MGALQASPEPARSQDPRRVERGLEPTVNLERGDRRVAEASGDRGSPVRCRRPRRRASGAPTRRSPSSGSPTHAIPTPINARQSVLPVEDGLELRRRDRDLGDDRRRRSPRASDRLVLDGAPRRRRRFGSPPSVPRSPRAILRARPRPTRASPRRRRGAGPHRATCAPPAVPRPTHQRRAFGSGRTLTATWTIAPSVPREPVASRCTS